MPLQQGDGCMKLTKNVVAAHVAADEIVWVGASDRGAMAPRVVDQFCELPTLTWALHWRSTVQVPAHGNHTGLVVPLQLSARLDGSRLIACEQAIYLLLVDHLEACLLQVGQ